MFRPNNKDNYNLNKDNEIFALLMPDVMQMYTKSKSMVCKVDKKKSQLLPVCYDLLSYVDE